MRKLLVFRIDNALYNIAFGNHIKTAEPVDMPFAIMIGLGPRNSVLHGVTISKVKGAVMAENVCQTSLIP